VLNYLRERYLTLKNKLQNIDLRDIEKATGIIKAYALLNFSFRERLPDGSLLLTKKMLMWVLSFGKR
jgi:hypothetical protein